MGGQSLFTTSLHVNPLSLFLGCPPLLTSTHHYLLVLLGFKWYLISSYWRESFSVSSSFYQIKDTGIWNNRHCLLPFRFSSFLHLLNMLYPDSSCTSCGPSIHRVSVSNIPSPLCTRRWPSVPEAIEATDGVREWSSTEINRMQTHFNWSLNHQDWDYIHNTPFQLSNWFYYLKSMSRKALNVWIRGVQSWT